MTKKRINITMSPAIRALADEVMETRRFGDLSGFLEQLIREEWERRNGMMQPTPAPVTTFNTRAEAVSVSTQIVKHHAEQIRARDQLRSVEGASPKPSAVAETTPPAQHSTARRKPR
jgi:hypothetical protein